MGLLVIRVKRGLLTTIIINVLFWTLLIQPWNINWGISWGPSNPTELKAECEQKNNIWTDGGVDSKGRTLLGTCSPAND